MLFGGFRRLAGYGSLTGLLLRLVCCLAVSLTAAFKRCLQFLEPAPAIFQQCGRRTAACRFPQPLLLVAHKRVLPLKLRLPLRQLLVEPCKLLLQRLHGKTFLVQKLRSNLQLAADFLGPLILAEHLLIGSLCLLRGKLREAPVPFCSQLARRCGKLLRLGGQPLHPGLLGFGSRCLLVVQLLQLLHGALPAAGFAAQLR